MIFVTFGFAFLTATFSSVNIFPTPSLFLFFFLCLHAVTKRVAPSASLDIYQKLDNNTTICSDRGLAFEISNLTISFTIRYNPTTSSRCMNPPTVQIPQRDRRSPFSAKQRNVLTRISIFQRMTSCTLPKTEPVGDDLQDLLSTALRSPDDDDDDDETVSINSVEKTTCVSLSHRRQVHE